MGRLEEIMVEHFRISDETSKLIHGRISFKSEEEARNFAKVIEDNMQKIENLGEEIDVLINNFIS
ncbi:hypothetical protein JHL18_13110 [Clostridium sp. YIM B02505]|uniref:Uncharacterized protein n=1 Tax=Clostridium yunnanense TaxID=2800325 RepID=A0ABS1EQ73_9CLOT|nr:hypothetical protein [Clostridium yunnanense]MBK1811561.1 hypothetical protein [Clostridium yunnanense]